MSRAASPKIRDLIQRRREAPSRRMAANSVLVAILRDAGLRPAPQDEVEVNRRWYLSASRLSERDAFLSGAENSSEECRHRAQHLVDQVLLVFATDLGSK